MNKLSYILYFLIYSLISYLTDLGFSYTNGFEFLWGSIVCALISGIIGNIIFRLSYDITGILSSICSYNYDERKTTHWKFRLIFSLPVFLFSVTPLCPMVMTPIVHITFIFVSEQCNSWVTQFSDKLLNSLQST